MCIFTSIFTKCHQSEFLKKALIAGLVCGMMGCGKHSKDDTTGIATPYSGFAVAAIAPDYTSSKLFFQGLIDGKPADTLKTLLTGESGDPWPITLNDKLYLFNRSSNSLNFRTIDPHQTDGATAQIKTEKAGIGDPHDALWLSNDRLLLANYIAGKLVVINPANGTVVQEITADWDIGTDVKAKFNPESFYRVSGSSTGEIYVLHQGRNSDFSGYNNSQQLFILKDDGANITVIDADGSKAKVQGIKINVFNPQIISASIDPNKPIIAGFCTIFDTANPCTSGFEQVDLASRTSTMIFDRTKAEEKGNGLVVGTKSGKFYAATAKSDGSNSYKSQIQVFDPVNSTAKTFYEISDANYASYAISYDARANRLYVGEKNTDQTGKLSIFDLSVDGSEPDIVTLPLLPYGIAFVP